MSATMSAVVLMFVTTLLVGGTITPPTETPDALPSIYAVDAPPGSGLGSLEWNAN